MPGKISALIQKSNPNVPATVGAAILSPLQTPDGAQYGEIKGSTARLNKENMNENVLASMRG